MQAFAKEMAGVVRAYTARETERLERKIDTLKSRIEALEFDQKSLKFVGVHQRALTYQKNNICTHQGGTWIALRDTSQTPGDGGEWQLMIKGR